MTIQEEIRRYFASEYCGWMNQEYCSGCKLITKGEFCEDAYEYADEILKFLDGKGMVRKIGRLPHHKLLAFLGKILGSAEDELERAGYVATERLIND